MISDDHNFKNLILDYSLQALQFFAPEEMKNLPPGVQITPLRQEQTKERLGDRFYELDVALQLDFPDGSREAIVFCIEEDSRAEKMNWRRHAVYCLQLSELLNTVRIVPIVIYPFSEKPPALPWQLATERHVYLDFQCTVVTLGALDASKHVNSSNLVERLCLPMMKQSDADKWPVIAKSYEGLLSLEQNWDKRVKYFTFISHYAELKPEEIAGFSEKYVEQATERKHIMNLADALLEQGHAKGVAVGEAKGEAKGKVEGWANAILEFYKTGILSRDAARAKLESLASENDPHRSIVNEALKRIDAEKPH